MARTYNVLLRNRVIVAGLTLGLITVMVGVLLDIALTGQRSTIAEPTRKLIQPLNPQLDLSVLERLEQYEHVSFEQAREGVRQSREQDLASEAVVEVGLSGSESDPASVTDPGTESTDAFVPSSDSETTAPPTEEPPSEEPPAPPLPLESDPADPTPLPIP